MRPFHLLLLAALLLAGGLGWLLFSSGEHDASVAQLDQKEEEPEDEFVPADMRAPDRDSRESVAVSEEAKAKQLLDIRNAPEEEVVEEVPVGTITVSVVDEAGEPIEDLLVVRTFEGPKSIFVSTQSRKERTDSAGRARFTELPVGPYKFSVRPGVLSKALFVRRALRRLNPEMDDKGFVARTIREGVGTELQIVFPNLHTLAGTVIDGGAPLADAAVCLYLTSDDALDAEHLGPARIQKDELDDLVPNDFLYEHELLSPTDSEGKFRFDNLTSGRYTISVERPTRGMRQMWDLTLPDRSASIELILDSLSVYGIVTDTEGLPIAGAKLAVERVRVDELGTPRPVEVEFIGEALHRAGATQVVESGADGSFRIHGVDGSSPLVVVARSPWMTTARSQVFGFARDETEQAVDIRLRPAGKVTAQLYTRPFWDLFLRLRATPLDRMGATIMSPFPDGENQLVLIGIRPGRYTLELCLSTNDVSVDFVPEELAKIARTDGTLSTLGPIEAEVVAGETLEFTLTVP